MIATDISAFKQHGRKKPYKDVARVACARCGCKPSRFQWTSCCANGNRYVALCKVCDIKLNRAILRFLGWSNWREMAFDYKCAASED